MVAVEVAGDGHLPLREAASAPGLSSCSSVHLSELTCRQNEGTATPCLVTQELDYQAKSGGDAREDERIIKNVAATTYAGRCSAELRQ